VASDLLGTYPAEGIAEDRARPARATLVLGAAIVSQLPPGRLDGSRGRGTVVEHRDHPADGVEPDGVDEQVDVADCRRALVQVVVQGGAEPVGVVEHLGPESRRQVS
jgi:hypothetical protein